MKIGQKLISGFVAVIVLAAAIGGVSFYGLSRINKVYARLHESQEANHYSIMMMVEVKTQLGKFHEYMMNSMVAIMGEEMEFAAAALDKSTENFHKYEERLEEISPIEETKQLLDEEKSIYRDYKDLREEVMMLIKEGKIAEAHRKAIKEIDPKSEELLTALTRIMDHHMRMVTAAHSEVTKIITFASSSSFENRIK